jgi:diguanylate cyclase (GGDEF)-like protein
MPEDRRIGVSYLESPLLPLEGYVRLMVTIEFKQKLSQKILNSASSQFFYRNVPHGMLRLENWLRENRRPLLDLMVILFMLGLVLPFIFMTDAAEVLYAYSRRVENWQLDEIVLSLAAVSFFLAVFATRRWIDALKFMRRSNTDSLTGLNNQRRGREVLEQEIHRAMRYHRPLSLIMFDIDHYKEFNDSLGHQVGDGVLKKISKIAQTDLRVTDTLVRWGGDEFLIICVETDLQTAQQIAERLRENIEGNPVQGLWNTTASFGVAEFESDDDLNSFTRRVDDRLYMAKEQGKNRVA